MEEISDNRPREIKFVKDYTEEAAPIRFTEDLARFFEGYIFKFEIWDTNRESQEETFLEAHQIDISCLLMEKTGGEKSWSFDKL